jgi:penicillin-binding protein A
MGLIARARRVCARLRPLIVVVALLAGGCTTHAKDLASPEQAADAFIDAWNSRDANGMQAAFDHASSVQWAPAELETFLDRTLDEGAVESFDVERSGDIEGPSREAMEAEEAVSEPVPVPYEVTYSSRATQEPVTLEGSFEMTYTRDDDEWAVAFDKGLLWPGIDGAAGFRIQRRWLGRGRILDRRGHVLARRSGVQRVYPFDDLAGSTVGHLEPITKRTLAGAAEGHAVGDLVGASGLEAAYEERLAGTPSTTLEVVSGRPKVIEKLGGERGTRGRDVRATLDIRVQLQAAIAFGDTVGGAVVLRPDNGDILAAVSAYEINPNDLLGVNGVSPFNRALSGLYPPGSSMKVVTAGAALDAGVVTSRTRLTGPKHYRGVRNFESESFKTLDLATALKFSVNTAFAQVAQKLGARRLFSYARAFGFNREPTMPLSAATSSFPFPKDDYDLMWGSIGQAQDLATPLEMASVAATVANGGVRMEPRSSPHDRKAGARVLSARTARTLGLLMESVVVGGTGTAARIAGVRVAGKTGTAEVDVNGKRKNHAWFTSFAPLDRPQVAVAIVSEYGGIGGEVAAPIARGILERILPLTRK